VSIVDPYPDGRTRYLVWPDGKPRFMGRDTDDIDEAYIFGLKLATQRDEQAQSVGRRAYA
jgi:hypothetical protein